MNQVSLHDVEDCERFVWKIIRRHMKFVPPGQLEDLVGDALVMLVDLAAKYDYDKDQGEDGSFAGYATYLMPMKLKEQWFARQPEWQRVKSGGKVVKVIRYKRALSFEESVKEDQHKKTTKERESKMRFVGDFVSAAVVVQGEEDDE